MSTDIDPKKSLPSTLKVVPAAIQDRIILRCYWTGDWSATRKVQAVAGTYNRILKLQLEHDGVSVEKLMCWKGLISSGKYEERILTRSNC